MPERAYFNSIPGRQRVEIGFTPAEIPELLLALELTAAPGAAAQRLRDLLAEAHGRFTKENGS